MAVLLFLALDIAYFSANVTGIATSTECDSEGFKDLFEGISNEDANILKAVFVFKCPIKITLPTSTFLLASELTNQVWQPPKI